MIAKSGSFNGTWGEGNGNGRRNGNGSVTRCVTFDREALTDLQELAWAANVPVDALVREAVERYRRAPAARV